MQKIVPHLWFDRQAKEAAEFYVSIFPDSKIVHSSVLHGTPSGDCDVLTFELMGHVFMAISAGPHFRINPSISFMVNLDPSVMADAAARIDALWEKLSAGGKVMMPLGAYPFSRRYGWVEDKYGVSWQLILTDPDGEPRPAIIPSLMFVGDACGQAKKATDAYLEIFGDARRGTLATYGSDAAPDKEGDVMFTDFMLEGRWFSAMDSARMHGFGFSEAVSLVIRCRDQEEIDRYWKALSSVPEAEQCGWLKDPYGVSWQVTPVDMERWMREGTPEQVDRLTQAFLKMKKFDLAELRRAYEGA